MTKVTDQDLAQLAKTVVERLQRIADGPAAAGPTRVCPTCGTTKRE